MQEQLLRHEGHEALFLRAFVVRQFLSVYLLLRLRFILAAE
jgi:hypothetical protein